MPRDFYPFVEDEPDAAGEGPLTVTHPARIAVYDDTAAAPRVVVVEPKDVRAYLEEITATVSRLVREQGGTIPFMVIREIVENFVHAYFEAPTITILDGGNTIRFSDQGPGIKEKGRALEYGTTSATEEMRHYIRGVGSGLPYAQQYMVDKGGSLEIEDNISGGTVVTISTHPTRDARAVTGAEGAADDEGAETAPAAMPWQAAGWGWPQQAPYPGYQQPAPPYGAWQQPQPYAPAGMTVQGPQDPMAFAPGLAAPGAYPQPQLQPQQPAWQQVPQAPAFPEIKLDARSRQALALLSERGAAGPTDLVQAFGSSAATWSRALSSLAAQGAVVKGGQKYHLTEFGQALAQRL